MHITSINIYENKTTIFWKYNLKNLTINIENLKQISLADSCELIFILTFDNIANMNFPNKLIAYNFNGDKIYEVAPPKNYRFYYFSDHFQSPSGKSMVCVGEPDMYGRDMWHFGIDAKTGVLTKICLAY